jgi:photosystem II stability/assembly factor-like uncharacterized protein
MELGRSIKAGQGLPYTAPERLTEVLLMPRPLHACAQALLLLLALAPATAAAATVDPIAYQDLSYRLIGPFRGSRTVGGVGVPSRPNVFFVGVNNGGVWKTDDYGRTWVPIFDDAPTGSVGDLAVSPSDPDVIYVGTGEGLHRPDLAVGDGIFKSTDGGASWRHVGLADVQQVARIIVHPSDPDVVFVAGLGHPYGPNEERGVFRTVDGGESWERVLYLDEDTGAIQVEFDPTNPDVLYADLWDHREGPWENASFAGRDSGLYKSTDGGDTWRRLSSGLPDADAGLGRIGVGIAPSDPRRMYATVDAKEGGGIYRSDDAGESWRRIHDDRRLWGRGGDFGEIRVHPTDPDTVFVANIAAYRSDDAGATWTSIKGAPGGDDYHRIWINPHDPEVMLFVADQGATITVNGGRTWSSWYNQPTAQLYHVATDNAFPYWVYGGQQESGAIGTASRGNGGQISFRDWVGIGADEYAYVAPDPLDSNLIYGGRVVRFDKRTGQSQNVAPEALRSGDYRMVRTLPLLFHPADPKTLFFATNVLWKTTTGGDGWEIVSPDLTRPQPAVPESIGSFRTPELDTMARRGVIYAVAPSPLDAATIWAGTDDGLVHVTRDGGGEWHDVTPSVLAAWDKVAQIDAGHFDRDTAYLAVNAIRKDDMRPHVYRTHDGGASWQRIVNGLPADGPVNVVREDPKQPGMLFAGTERSVYFSADDGDSWNPLRQNLPPSSMRDLVIHDDDLVVGTHGRSIWILDDIAPLRELAGLDLGRPHLFAPPPAIRVRWNMFSDTPLPPEEPAGENPPDGAILDYWLPAPAADAVLEIVDGAGETIRRFSSVDPPETIDPTTLPHPTYWIRPPQELSPAPGHHRFVWDLRYPPPAGTAREFSIAAVHGRTPSAPRGPFASPGEFTVRLTVDGRTSERPLALRMDPRVTASEEEIALQTALSKRLYAGYQRLQAFRETLDRALAVGTRDTALAALRGAGEPGNPDTLYGSIRATPDDQETVVGLQEKFLFMLELVQAADARPTAQAIDATAALESALERLLARWQEASAAR